MNLYFSLFPGDNSLDVFVPEFWAQEALALLEENMVVANLVHKDFSTTVATMGDTVNVQRPAKFVAKRKSVNDDVTVQAATATNVAVKLNQQVHVSFLIRDGEESKGRLGLVDLYMKPAMMAQAKFVDQVLLGQFPQYLDYTAGALGGATSSTVSNYILDMRNVQNVALVPDEPRNLILTPNFETTCLKVDKFTDADRVGDDGTALRRASLGKKWNYNLFMCQNMSSVQVGATLGYVDGAVNLGAGYSKGHTAAIVVDGFTGAIAQVGRWVTIAGDDTPYRIKAKAETSSNTTSITLDRALRRAVADNAVVRIYRHSAVNNAAGYATGYDGYITIDNGGDSSAALPKVGQLISFEDTTLTSATPVYTVIETNGSTYILLDRPLEEDLADDQSVNVGPYGEYNFAFHRNALALVTRPLALPKQGAGALSAVISYGGLAMRATITYDGYKQGHLVTLDMLLGTKVLYPELGGVMFG